MSKLYPGASFLKRSTILAFLDLIFSVIPNGKIFGEILCKLVKLLIFIVIIIIINIIIIIYYYYYYCYYYY